MIKKSLLSCLMFAVLAVGFSCGKMGTGNTNTTTGTETTSSGTETGNPDVLLEGLFVNPASAGANADGSSWAKAFKTIKDALDNLPAEGGNIYLAAGTYDDPRIVIKNKKNIHFFGSYKTTDTHTKELSQIADGEWTIFDGNLGANRLVSIKGANSENISFEGITFQNVKDETAFVIFAGNNLSIKNCRFLNNKNNEIENSNRIGAGSALYIEDAINLNVINSTFDGNQANRVGGAIYLRNSGATFADLTFENNECDEDGGAIYLDLTQNDSKATLTNLTFTNNSSKMDNGGGAIFAIFDTDNAKNQLVFSGSLTQSGNRTSNNSGNFLAISFGKEQDDDDADLELEITVKQSDLAEFITVGSSGLKLENSADVYFPVADPEAEGDKEEGEGDEEEE